MSREDPQLRIRLPVELKEIIEASSKENNRSMNAEIVTMLELAIRVCRDFGPEDGPVVQQFKERLDALGKKSDNAEQENLIPKLLEIIEKQKNQVDKLIGMVEKSAPLSDEYKKKYLRDNQPVDDKKPT
ncbi:TPA: Arc family DNA-binding protein [Citrobacter farmeri]